MGMWDSAVLTNSGLNLMAQWVDGAVLTIDKATAGEGTVNEAYLMGQTQLVAEKKQLSIVRQDRVANGVRIQMQCTNEGVAEEFTINQIGVWAHLDDGASVLLSIYQDDTGVLVPTNAEMPEYVFTFYAVLQVSNTGTLQVTLDASAVVTQGQLEAATAAIDAEIEKIVDGTTEVGHATNADHATSADTATNADHATSADTATNAGHAASADTATNADHATNADEATNATYAQTASTADTAGYATTAKGDANGNDIAATYATKAELAAAGQFDPNGTYPNLTAGDATHAASADAATKATQDEAGNNIQSTYATKAELNTKADQAALNGVINGTTPVAKATAADSATHATNDGLGRNIADTYVLKGEEGWGLNLYACTVSFSTTTAIYFCYPYQRFSFDLDDIADDLYRKGMRSISRAFPVVGIEPSGGQVVGMYSKNGKDITLAVITGNQLTEMSLPTGTLDKSSYT